MKKFIKKVLCVIGFHPWKDTGMVFDYMIPNTLKVCPRCGLGRLLQQGFYDYYSRATMYKTLEAHPEIYRKVFGYDPPPSRGVQCRCITKIPEDQLCVECQEHAKKKGYELCSDCLEDETIAMKYGHA